ncbi:hypothetical protein [Donghicola sp.]|jgi:flagellar FliL protein|uniref:hypothetical protein n=1 Tax=Donghicola sp. TaxID=1929294 RepID=UPI0025D1BFA5|nr:hypothetical protein [Donghicola sp.]MCT4578567.1 hypothetical protein [Donghicola sp.]
MSDQAAESEAKKGGSGVVPGIILGLVAAIGGYAVVGLDLLHLRPEEETAVEEPRYVAPAAGVFLDIPQIIVMNGPFLAGRHLRFRGALEVRPEDADKVAVLMPRVVDVLQTFLRSVKAEYFDYPDAIDQFRDHMRHRVVDVIGEEPLIDLLILELVPN